MTQNFFQKFQLTFQMEYLKISVVEEIQLLTQLLLMEKKQRNIKKQF